MAIHDYRVGDKVIVAPESDEEDEELKPGTILIIDEDSSKSSVPWVNFENGIRAGCICNYNLNKYEEKPSNLELF